MLTVPSGSVLYALTNRHAGAWSSRKQVREPPCLPEHAPAGLVLSLSFIPLLLLKI